MKTPLNQQIRYADKKVMDQTPVFLFEVNRCGDRMGKPGDPNNVYYAAWFEFYSFGSDLNPRSEGSSLNFKDPTTHRAVSGGNGVSEVDVIEAFRKANPGRTVVMLNIDPFKGDLEAKMNQALQKYREDGQAILSLSPFEAPVKREEIIR